MKTFILLLMIFLLASSVVTVVGGLWENRHDTYLINHGFCATGTVIRKYFEDDSPRIEYAFTTPDGQLTRGHSEFRNDLPLESNVEIAYDPAAPSDSMLVPEGVTSPWLFIALAAAFAIVGGCGLYLWITRIRKF